MKQLVLQSSTKCSAFLVIVLVFHSVVLMSPLVYAMGFRAAVAIPITIALLILIVALHRQNIQNRMLMLVLAMLTTASITGLYWESWRAALLPAYFGVSLLGVSIASEEELRRLTTVSSMVLIVLLIGAWTAFLLAFHGFSPLGEISGISGRRLYFYYTTLTPTVIGNFIRPAGIYDEPGALSLVVCVIAFLRRSLQMNQRFTWLLLLLGFVTFSLAHLAYVSIHFLSERRTFVAWRNLAIILTIGFLTFSSVGILEVFDSRLASRLVISSNPEQVITGDNRTLYFRRAWEAISYGEPQIFMFGADVSCIEGRRACAQSQPIMDFNPLTPLAHFGILISWPYYLFLMFTLGIGILRRQWWPLAAIGLLYSQRPSMFSAGYSMLAAASVIVFYRHAAALRFDVVFGDSSSRRGIMGRTRSAASKY